MVLVLSGWIRRGSVLRARSAASLGFVSRCGGHLPARGDSSVPGLVTLARERLGSVAAGGSRPGVRWVMEGARLVKPAAIRGSGGDLAALTSVPARPLPAPPFPWLERGVR